MTSFGWRVAFRVASGMIFVSGLLCSWTFSSKDTPDMQMLKEETESIPEVRPLELKVCSMFHLVNVSY